MVPFNEVCAEVLVAPGTPFDQLRDSSQEGLPPLSVEATIVMNSGKPADDSATLRDFGITYRPTLDTFSHTTDWLRGTGQKAPVD